MKYAAWLLVIGACSDSTFNGVEQQVADPAPALTVTSATFHSAVGGSSVTYCSAGTCALNPESQVRWGTPFGMTAQSGLGFDRAASVVITYGTNFDLGSLTHFNFPTLSTTWASGVSLDLGIRIDPSVAGPAIFDNVITIPLAIHETTNEAPCLYPSTVPCADKITFLTSTFQLASTTSTTVYDLDILGFFDPATSTTLDGLISNEGGTSGAVLQAVLSEHCVDVDNDNVCDEGDTCPGISNPGNLDSDGDGKGDACDVCPLDALDDADGDGHCANVDNCPADANSDQVDTDGDGKGDACDEACPCDDPWKNHGEYVSCVAHHTQDLVQAGLMTHQERAVIVSQAGQSSCGKPHAPE